MALKPVLSTLDGLDDAQKALYKKNAEDGKFYLEVEGMVDKTKLDEFRNNNTELKTKLEKLEQDMAKFAGIDPKKYKEFMDKFESDEEKKLIKEGNIEAVVQLRTEKMRKDFEAQLAAKDQAIAAAQDSAKKSQGERDSYIVEAELRKAVENPEMGFQPGLSDLVKAQVLKEFTYKDGKVIRVKPDGSPVFGAKGDPATINEFLQDIVKERPYLVKASTGGGAENKGPGQGQNGKSMPRSEFDKKSPDEKMKLSKEHVVLTE